MASVEELGSEGIGEGRDMNWTEWYIVGELQVGELIVLIALGMLWSVIHVLWEGRGL